MSRDLDYFRSERFIHDDLQARAAAMVEQVREDWRKARRVDSFAISWPSESVATDDGKTITQAVMMPIPDDFGESEKTAALKRMVERTKAYGIVLIERVRDELRILFETHHGARAWVIPLERHGDLLVPGPTRVSDNGACLGLLWRAHRGES